MPRSEVTALWLRYTAIDAAGNVGAGLRQVLVVCLDGETVCFETDTMRPSACSVGGECIDASLASALGDQTVQGAPLLLASFVRLLRHRLLRHSCAQETASAYRQGPCCCNATAGWIVLYLHVNPVCCCISMCASHAPVRDEQLRITRADACVKHRPRPLGEAMHYLELYWSSTLQGVSLCTSRMLAPKGSRRLCGIRHLCLTDGEWMCSRGR